MRAREKVRGCRFWCKSASVGLGFKFRPSYIRLFLFGSRVSGFKVWDMLPGLAVSGDCTSPDAKRRLDSGLRT